ncbi:XcbB/CpsF family capsular polysaccharide biosynthesis protein [Pseudoxanthomonas sp. PXM01]|uniref:XcbB/CpsF family capsular polysaccharide biosynthesis protein n=1 Tax=Pseudoxanthomonas sp. PXM01 TaxID=2769295 RepID=UPI001786EE8F|nr:XcbB/CpsF family capsular polysaccharide biosynthesis protein [Pseudoxanthomonas sp. PXM01]MBD9469817.1 XcbB/CpsF family capsular polysaccharide biosynthesis protein [Pseudoxanthomonas sp. PXM01]
MSISQNVVVPALAGRTDVKVSLSELQSCGVSRLVADNPMLRILRVDHASVACDARNLLDLAMKDKSVRSVVVELANHAFVAYMLKEGVTSFVHHSFIGKLWQRVKDGPCEVDRHDLVYSVDEPLAGLATTRLVVVFSSMAGKIRTSSLMRHFEQNFATIQKYLPAGTAVLRIADFGGVVGGYYMNTLGLPETENHVQGLIADVAGRFRVDSRDVVLYGASKGGSAALYHGLLGNYPVVAADPILADEYYIRTFNDSHFTVGVFPEDKKTKFGRLAASTDLDRLPPIAILCSKRSPQYPYVMETLGEPMRSHVAFFDSRHAGIKTHPDVSPKTLNLAVMLLNMQFYRLPIAGGMHVVDEVSYQEDSGSRAI